MVSPNPIQVSLSVAAGKVRAVAKGKPSEESHMRELLEATNMSRTEKDAGEGA